MQNTIGKNILIDLSGIDSEIFNNTPSYELKLRELAAFFNSTPLKYESHTFSPQGFTAVLLLRESHISIHTWPEKDYIAIDFFTCGEDSRTESLESVIKQLFSAKNCRITYLNRNISRGE